MGRPLIGFIRLIRLAPLALLCACSLPPPHATAPPPTSGDRLSEAPPLLTRQGRYTLVDTAPLAAQRDLLAQLIETRIPSELNPTVQDALQHVLRRSGYGLCPASSDLQLLYSRPLPAAHYRLGPMSLRDAVQVLAGNAWQLQVDELSRTLCFVRRPAPLAAPGVIAAEPRP